MKDHNRNRLATITGRYTARLRDKTELDRRAFDAAFLEVREAIIRPVLEEIAVELRSAGHGAVVECDTANETPSIALVLRIGSTPKVDSDRVVFAVIHRRSPIEVLAYFVVRPPAIDIRRFASPAEIAAEQIEQIVVDAVEHIFACYSL